MTEQLMPEEAYKPKEPLLALAEQYGIVITQDMRTVIERMQTEMTLQNQRDLYTQLHLLIEQADQEAETNDQTSQIKRQIGRILVTAHMMHTTGEQWGMVESELQDALLIADQTADAGHEDCIDVGDTINQLITDLEPKQS